MSICLYPQFFIKYLLKTIEKSVKQQNVWKVRNIFFCQLLNQKKISVIIVHYKVLIVLITWHPSNGVKWHGLMLPDSISKF